MNCQEVTPILELLLDDELAVEKSAPAMEHLNKCPPCQKEWDAQLALRKRFGSYADRIAVPEGLLAGIEKRVGARLRDEQKISIARPFTVLALAAASLALLVTGVFLVRNASTPPMVAVAPGSSSQPAPVTPMEINQLVAHYTGRSPASEPSQPAGTAELADVSRQAGYTVKPVRLPGFELADAGVIRLGKYNTRVAHFIYRRTVNGKTEEICCFQTKQGQLESSGLNEHFLDGRKLCCGKVDDMSVVYIPGQNDEYVLVSQIAQEDLLELARRS